MANQTRTTKTATKQNTKNTTKTETPAKSCTRKVTGCTNCATTPTRTGKNAQNKG